ncbi:MAG: 4-oxalomesaconate tautomerase [Burkholderiaceae bacterium]|nr:4-oxalomesaconate tautomerase [Burkholderiaceae bacterium]
MQTTIPCLLMRGGTSRGPYFDAADLPPDRTTLARVLLSALGSGHPLQIDGVGGGASVTSKVAMLSRSRHPEADVDYFFAQVGDTAVDFGPTCGNILAGVGPAAIEMGLVAPGGELTRVRINCVNTGALVHAAVRTSGGSVVYDGEARIDGVPGSAAPILLDFMGVVGSQTGKLFPTGRSREEIAGIEVSCVDVAVPMLIARSADFGLSGYETPAEIDADRAFYERMEPIRQEAGRRMGLGDVAGRVIPRVALLAPARFGGTVTSRYFVPQNCHPSHAVTGAICVGACLLAPDTVAATIVIPERSVQPTPIIIEHPSGRIEVAIACRGAGEDFEIECAGVLRTARKIMAGTLFVPGAVWAPAADLGPSAGKEGK